MRQRFWLCNRSPDGRPEDRITGFSVNAWQQTLLSSSSHLSGGTSHYLHKRHTPSAQFYQSWVQGHQHQSQTRQEPRFQSYMSVNLTWQTLEWKKRRTKRNNIFVIGRSYRMSPFPFHFVELPLSLLMMASWSTYWKICGAFIRMPTVPAMVIDIKMKRLMRSITKAMYFQSSSTCKEKYSV